jgi:hypothetical protein
LLGIEVEILDETLFEELLVETNELELFPFPHPITAVAIKENKDRAFNFFI